MKAIVAEKAGTSDVLTLKEIAKPDVKAGWVLIQVKAFGLNRAELFTRQGDSPGVTFPRVLGIEAVGIVESAPNTPFEPGQKVAAIMGGMGRQFNGSYAEYTLVPESSVFPLETELDWASLGAIPEMFQTVMGSLTVGLEVHAGQTLLIRGGTSSIGMTTARLAKDMGLTILSTTRNPNKRDKLKANGVDHVIIDDGDVAGQVRELYPDGVDRVLELIGTKTLLNSLKSAKRGGIVCMTGILGGEWTLSNFTPMEDIPTGVRLTSYAGEASDLTKESLQAFVDDVTSGRQTLNLDKIFKLEELSKAHRYMESNQASGKVVVVIE
ncbi:MAG: NADPH:quinone reductase [Anaerolineae bacterium SG8_19]|jgi:NADPH2:quinone reductase|nr:MAG: NADPH:quinone reductase [Anaerolineae bacterium SG8_19]